MNSAPWTVSSSAAQSHTKEGEVLTLPSNTHRDWADQMGFRGSCTLTGFSCPDMTGNLASLLVWVCFALARKAGLMFLLLSASLGCSSVCWLVSTAGLDYMISPQAHILCSPSLRYSWWIWASFKQTGLPLRTILYIFPSQCTSITSGNCLTPCQLC